MSHRSRLGAVTLLLGILALNSCTSSKAGLTIMTYNIRHGVGMDRVLDLERTAQVIQAAKPDVVILNEVDHGTQRAFGVRQADSLGRLLGMYAMFGRSISYDGGQYGNALLSKFPILNFQVIDLSVDTLREGRSIFRSSIAFGSDTLVVMGTHLGLTPEERLEQVQGILAVIPPGKPVILGGDFNFEPDSQPYAHLTGVLRDGMQEGKATPEMTFPADVPERRIDYIFISDKINLLPTAQLNHEHVSSASDHRPQILRIEL